MPEMVSGSIIDWPGQIRGQREVCHLLDLILSYLLDRSRIDVGFVDLEGPRSEGKVESYVSFVRPAARNW